MIPARPFYLIRHGETVMNALKLTCGGGVDTELNDTGKAQAAEAARVLAALPQKPTLIINSGMRRTRETTAILNEALNIPVMEDPDLREHMLGVWERQPWADVMPDIVADKKPDGGESATEFAARVRATFTRALETHPTERLLFVAHGGTFHSFLRFHGVQKRLFIPNAVLHAFEPEPAHSPMPWRVTQCLPPSGTETIVQITAPICPSYVEEAA